MNDEFIFDDEGRHLPKINGDDVVRGWREKPLRLMEWIKEH